MQPQSNSDGIAGLEEAPSRTGATAQEAVGGPGTKTDLIMRGILGMTTITLLLFWLGKHGYLPFMGAAGAASKVVIITAVIALAGFAQGLTGFGFGLVAIAL